MLLFAGHTGLTKDLLLEIGLERKNELFFTADHGEPSED